MTINTNYCSQKGLTSKEIVLCVVANKTSYVQAYITYLLSYLSSVNALLAIDTHSLTDAYLPE